MSAALVPVITRKGLAAVVRAQGDGLQASIVSMAVGQGVNSNAGYVPSKDATALASEAIRVPLLSGTRIDPAGFRVLARVPAASSPANYIVREVGFFLSTGELLALWSSTDFPLAAKTGLSDIDLAFDLFLEQLPVSALALTVTEPDIPDTTGVLATLLCVQANQFNYLATASLAAFAKH